MADRKHILILCYSDLSADARVLRQIEALGERYTLATAAYAPAPSNGGRFFQLGADTTALGLSIFRRKLVSARHRVRSRIHQMRGDREGLYWDPARRHALAQLSRWPADLIIANDINTLPLAMALREVNPAVRIIFDAHEYFPKQFEEDPAWVVQHQAHVTDLCCTLMPLADRCTTVSPRLADQYAELTGVRPMVILNAPRFEDLLPRTVSDGPIRLVHHGGISFQRGTLDLLQIMQELERSHELHLYPVVKGENTYAQNVFDRARHMPNVIVHGAVPPADLPGTLNAYDLGVHRLLQDNWNHLNTLPNKTFDFVQARIGQVVTPGSAMSELVERHHVGAVATDFSLEAMAACIQGLQKDDIMRFKQNAHHVAAELSATAGRDLLQGMVAELLSTPGSVSL